MNWLEFIYSNMFFSYMFNVFELNLVFIFFLILSLVSDFYYIFELSFLYMFNLLDWKNLEALTPNGSSLLNHAGAWAHKLKILHKRNWSSLGRHLLRGMWKYARHQISFQFIIFSLLVGWLSSLRSLFGNKIKHLWEFDLDVLAIKFLFAVYWRQAHDFFFLIFVYIIHINQTPADLLSLVIRSDFNHVFQMVGKNFMVYSKNIRYATCVVWKIIKW